jgi:hypothetical protein
VWIFIKSGTEHWSSIHGLSLFYLVLLSNYVHHDHLIIISVCALSDFWVPSLTLRLVFPIVLCLLSSQEYVFIRWTVQRGWTGRSVISDTSVLLICVDLVQDDTLHSPWSLLWLGKVLIILVIVNLPAWDMLWLSSWNQTLQVNWCGEIFLNGHVLFAYWNISGYSLSGVATAQDLIQVLFLHLD